MPSFKSSPPLPRPLPTLPSQPVSVNLPQAQLDAIAKPSWLWNRENCRWMARYSDPKWTLEELVNRMTLLRHDIGELTRMVENPPAEWDGLKWTEMHERLRGWQGHLNALERSISQKDMAMRRLSGIARSAPPAPDPAGTTPEPTPNISTSTDPFSEC